MSLIFNLVIIAAALAGFIVAFHIWRHRHRGSPLVCPVGFDCELVVNSKYATTLGLSNELLGLVYYALIGLVYLFLFFYPNWPPPVWFLSGLLLASFGSFAFSLYLLYVQLVKLKEWCTWCIFSSLCSTIIFLAVLAGWLG